MHDLDDVVVLLFGAEPIFLDPRSGLVEESIKVVIDFFLVEALEYRMVT